jgi:phospholipid/cholesterol/gamma-HCH transport system permease protein
MPSVARAEPRCRVEAGAERQVLHLSGDWSLSRLAKLDAVMAGCVLDPTRPLRLEAEAMESLDSAAAHHLVSRLRRLGFEFNDLELSGFTDHGAKLLRLVAERGGAEAVTTPSRRRRRRGLRQVVGWHAFHLLRGVRAGLSFFGQTGLALGDLARHPGHMRWRELFVQLEMVGLRAIPIIMLMSYLIGVVFAYLLGIQMQKFGANQFMVDGVSLGITREMAPMITAVLVAGRSGAAFTAHLGSMKVNQEIDAIVSLGLSPFQVLVLPRLFALVLMLPLLTFVADVAGILGAAQVATLHFDIQPGAFYERLLDVLPLGTAIFGLEKALPFAAAIALIACHGGFSVLRDARSIGLKTTSTVVRGIVAVILIDAAFAVAYPDIQP